ncbi:MAG: NAD-dependent epimerase/dehydratase family protein [Nitrososphaerales archaeon]
MNTIIDSDIESLLSDNKKFRISGKQFLVTGGAGFLGSWLCDILVAKNAKVYCIDNLSSGRAANIKHLLPNKSFVFKKHDITKTPINLKPDYIFHLASRPSPDDYLNNEIQTIDTNTEGTRKILELTRKTGAKLLFTSTSEVYGEATVFPTPETYYGNVNPSGPRACYDESKRLCESLCMAYYRTYGINLRIVRLFNTYGPRLRGDGTYGRALSRFIWQSINNKNITIWGNGKQTRSFCYITDMINGLMASLLVNKTNGETFNLGNPKETRIIDLANTIVDITNSKSKFKYLPMPDNDPRRRLPKINKAKQLIGFKPRVKLDKGLAKTINWQLNPS